MTMFYTDDAKTLFGKNGLLLGDFTLKVIGEMKLAADGKSGHWVCSCGTKERGIVVTRYDLTTRLTLRFIFDVTILRTLHLKSRID